MYSTGNFPGRPGRPGSSQGFPASSPSNSFPVPNKPTLPTKQGSPVHSQNGSLPPSPNRHPGKLLSSHGSQFQGLALSLHFLNTQLYSRQKRLAEIIQIK